MELNVQISFVCVDTDITFFLHILVTDSVIRNGIYYTEKTNKQQKNELSESINDLFKMTNYYFVVNDLCNPNESNYPKKTKMLIIYWEHNHHYPLKHNSDENPLKTLGMPPFQETWTALLNQTLPHSPLKSTETVQRSCVTVNVTRGAAQTLTGEDNVAEPSSSFQRCNHRDAAAQVWLDSLVVKKEVRIKRQRDKANVCICWESCRLLSEMSTCLLRVLWWGS